MRIDKARGRTYGFRCQMLAGGVVWHETPSPSLPSYYVVCTLTDRGYPAFTLLAVINWIRSTDNSTPICYDHADERSNTLLPLRSLQLGTLAATLASVCTSFLLRALIVAAVATRDKIFFQ